MLNIENINKVQAAILAAGEEHFEMSTWGSFIPHEDLIEHKCGTAACIGGWAIALDGGIKGHEGLVGRASKIFGITREQGWALFVPKQKVGDPTDPYRATPQQAVRVLDILIETGEIDWDRGMLEGAQ